MLHFLFVCLLVQASVCDIRTRKIPDRLNLAILALGLIRQWAAFAAAGGTAAGAAGALGQLASASAGGLLAAALPLYLIAVAFPGSIGGGDIKFTAAAGVFLGAASVLMGTAAGLVPAGLYAALLLAARKKTARQTFALGPFLAAGFLFAMAAGPV
jgi:prepilin signal peptidase PulO-like enzyme (type II secretory pathway)